MDRRREHVLTVLSRLRERGGLPLTEKKRAHVASWFRTLVKRGLVDCSAVEDEDGLKRKYHEAFPNAMTRGQYARAALSYVGGLTDAEYERQYPTVPRSRFVALFKELTIEGGRDRPRKTRVTLQE